MAYLCGVADDEDSTVAVAVSEPGVPAAQAAEHCGGALGRRSQGQTHSEDSFDALLHLGHRHRCTRPREIACRVIFPFGCVDQRPLRIVREEGENAVIGAVEHRRDLAEALDHDTSPRRETEAVAWPDQGRPVDDLVVADAGKGDSCLLPNQAVAAVAADEVSGRECRLDSVRTACHDFDLVVGLAEGQHVPTSSDIRAEFRRALVEHMFKIALVDRQEIHRVLLAEHVQRQRHPAEEEPRRRRWCSSATAAFEEATVVQQPHDLAGLQSMGPQE